MAPEAKRLYWVWADMLSRCRNKNHKSYLDYGGRGITVCERWRSFQDFRSDMGERPAGGMIERIRNSEGYGPNNCRWATRQEQNSNRRSCIYVVTDGERVTLREACRRRGLPYRPIVKRIQDRNWPVEMALTVPVGSGMQFYRTPTERAPR